MLSVVAPFIQLTDGATFLLTKIISNGHSSTSTVVDHLSNNPKVEGLSPAVAAGTTRDKMSVKSWSFYSFKKKLLNYSWL
jgi:hypothetical protein